MIDRSVIFSLQALGNASVDFCCRDSAPFFERQRRVLRRGVGNQAVQVVRQTLGNHIRYLQARQEQLDGFRVRCRADEDPSGVFGKNLIDAAFHGVGTRPFQDDSALDIGSTGELPCLCIDGTQDALHFRFPERTVVSGLDLEPDPAIGKLYNAIFETFRHQVPWGSESRPLPNKQQG